jgi:segregation and condensation protein A
VKATVDAASLTGYQLHLPTFDGPLDVLLQLIERERLAISDLSLVAVTEGFIAYIAALVDPPPSLLAEFAGIAARLLVLKSRALLPRPSEPEHELEVDDLADQLREYQRAKRAAGWLREVEQAEARSFARPARSDFPPPRVTLLAPPLAHLRRALVRSVARMRPVPEVVAMRPLVSIGEMIGRVRAAVDRAMHPLRFRELVRHDDRDETIAGFLALLTLWRRGEVEVAQDRLFAEIYVSASPGDHAREN